jgi:hypothetical protein
MTLLSGNPDGFSFVFGVKSSQGKQKQWRQGNLTPLL